KTGHYDGVDLLSLPDHYLPRNNYLPACSPDEYRARTPRVSWIEADETQPKRVSEYYRCVYRKMIGSSAERTLSGVLSVKQAAHIDGCFSLVLKSKKQTLDFSTATSSLPYYFFIKATGKSNFRDELARLLPILSNLNV